MEHKKIMALFEGSLEKYQEQSKGLPIRFNRTIALWLYTSTGIDFNKEVETQNNINMYANYIFNSSQSTDTLLYNMYLQLLYIEKRFQYSFDSYIEFSKASKETNEIEEQRDNVDYWLFDWHPKLVADEKKFRDALQTNFLLWKQETKLLQETLEKWNLFNPYTLNAYNLSYIFSILEKE